MQRRIGMGVIALAMVLLSACDKKEEPQKTVEPVVSAPEQPKRSSPDFGGVTKVSREVEAVGSTLEMAVVSALQSAVAQVNGVRVASQLQSLRQGIDVTVDGQNAGSVRAEAFEQKVVSGSQGMVLGYEILSQQEIDKVDEESIAKVRASDDGFSYSASASSDSNVKLKASGDSSASVADASARSSASYSGSASSSEKANVDVKKGASSYSSDVSHRKMRSYWKVKLRAEIAQYKAPDEKGRPKIVVVLPKTLGQGYPVGDSNVSSDEVARAVRGRLSDILTQTKRFIVLDREFGADMQAEIDHINSGNVRAQDSARIGQQLATDLLLIPTIERFEYPKSVRKLRMSDRELVSYSGGGRITLRLVNAATGEVVMSQSFEHKLASADPSTMPRVIDGKNMAAGMMDSLAHQIGGAIVTEVFPVSVVSLNGDQVVLSQGGESLQVGQRWKAVYLGEELKDPQTGNSLGRNELPVGTIRIDRIASQTSYGTWEEGAAKLGDKPFVPGAIELREQLAKIAQVDSGAVAGKVAQGQSAVAPSSAAAAKSKLQKPAVADAPKPAAQVKDDKW
ncbi:CsgG/HfaB family protein [Herbaspirillum sp. alder98]|uniref:CsgG/HfaB family protein n=1 Tax=Herbaspirillum sp. alder98 TaxID=2913096 RepID=UPI001CD86B3E|nr:CsgG/HfaB family protein [Herbaspirillum sp. alder98]MCA1324437.1 CsgG/HfaB family protein [Herbaspirillum sp. alder98]